MLGNFNKLLIENEKTKGVPKAIIDSLNQLLPRGFEYKSNREKCILSPISTEDSKRMKINVKLDISKEIIEKHKDNLEEYLYRTQTSLAIENFKIKIEDREFNINDIVKTPLTYDELNDFKGMLVPQEFPPAQIIKLKVINGKEYNLSFRRKPYYDMNVTLVENETLRVLDIKIYYNEITADIDMKININIEEASSVEQLLDALEIFKGFVTSNMEFDGNRIPQSTDLDNNIAWISDAINFWNKVKYIENELNIKFIPSKDLSKDDYSMVNELYMCLSKEEPIVYYEPFNYITMGKFELKSKVNFINKPNLCFEFIEEKLIDFLGCNFKVYSATILEDFVVSDIKKIEDGETRLYIKSENEKKTKLSRLYFTNSESAQKYLNDIRSKNK